MAGILHHSFDKDKIKKYKIFKNIVNNDIITIKTKKEYNSYKKALENNVIFNFDLNTEIGLFCRIRETVRI